MTNPMLDPAALERLTRIGGARLVRSMMDSFVENGAARVEAARAAAAAGDARGLSDAAHALKSSAGNVGATTLMLAAQKVEREATERPDRLATLSDELAAAFEDARRAAVRARDEAGG